MAYDKSITTKKGIDGGLEGGIVALLTMIIVGFLKRYIMDMDPGTENTIITLVGAVVAGLLLALTRVVRNWLKHKNDTQPVPVQIQTDQAPVQPAENTQANQ